MRNRTDFPRAFGRSGPCPWTAPACCSFPQDSLLSAVSGWGSNSAGGSPCRPARSRLPIRKRQPLGRHAACCRFGVTQPAATPTTPAPHSPRNFSSSPPTHLPPDSRLSRQSGSRLHAVQGLRPLPPGLEQHLEKTFIGRVSRGFDFLGVDFQPGAPLAPSAVSLARHTEKTARLHEQGASPERIGRYRQHWQRHLRGILGGPAAPAPTPPPPGGPTPPPAAPRAPVLSSRDPSLRPRCSRAGVQQTDRTNQNESNQNQLRSHSTSSTSKANS
jgi:hypothetical protein